jgi:hypothetical protein
VEYPTCDGTFDAAFGGGGINPGIGGLRCGGAKLCEGIPTLEGGGGGGTITLCGEDIDGAPVGGGAIGALFMTFGGCTDSAAAVAVSDTGEAAVAIDAAVATASANVCCDKSFSVVFFCGFGGE